MDFDKCNFLRVKSITNVVVDRKGQIWGDFGHGLARHGGRGDCRRGTWHLESDTADNKTDIVIPTSITH